MLVKDIPVLIELDSDAVRFLLERADRAAGTDLHAIWDEGQQPLIEPAAVYVEIGTLVGALHAVQHVDGPDGEKLRTRKDLVRQAQPHLSQHLLGVRGKESAAAFGCGLTAGKR